MAVVGFRPSLLGWPDFTNSRGVPEPPGGRSAVDPIPFILHHGQLRSWADQRPYGRLSWDDGLGWQQLALARAAVARGPPVVVLHRPEELPLQRPGVRADCGSVCGRVTGEAEP